MNPDEPHAKRHIPDIRYAIEELPGYLQKRYRNGNGFIEVRPSLDRKSRLYPVTPDFCPWPPKKKQSRIIRWRDEYDELDVPITEAERRKMRQEWSELLNAPTTEEAEQQEEARREQEQRKKNKMNRYIKRYFLQTGLYWEARKAGVGLRWLFIK